jgi:hypothetical protein
MRKVITLGAALGALVTVLVAMASVGSAAP